MNPIARSTDAIAILAGWSLMFLSVLVCAEVVSRKFFSFSFQSADELGGYILAISSVSGFAAALVSRSHTRVDIVWQRLPEGARAALNVFAYVAISGFAIFMAWYAWQTMAQSFRLSSRSFTPLQTPLWIPQALWFAGLAYFATVAVAMTCAAAIATLKDRAAANRVFGPTHANTAEIEIAAVASPADDIVRT